MLPIIFVMPIIQLIVLVNAATMEMKSVKITVVDNDLSATSRQYIGKFKASPFFKIQNYYFSTPLAENELLEGTTDVVINIPANFEKNLTRNNKTKVQIAVNAINGMVAGISNAYIQNITQNFNSEIVVKFIGVNTLKTPVNTIQTSHRFWYNPQLNYKTFMVPAILALLVTLIGLFLSAMNLVREKELGTIEQINVTPIKKYQFIAGKLIPFLLLGLVELAFGLTIGKFLFNIPMVGSIALLFTISAIYLLLILSIGLFISTLTNTQQQAMFVSFFIALICIMLSGIFTSTDSMPQIAQWINKINPIYYFMRIIRMLLVKGSGFFELITEIGSLLVYAIVMLSLAVFRYKKVGA